MNNPDGAVFVCDLFEFVCGDLLFLFAEDITVDRHFNGIVLGFEAVTPASTNGRGAKARLIFEITAPAQRLILKLAVAVIGGQAEACKPFHERGVAGFHAGKALLF